MCTPNRNKPPAKANRLQCVVKQFRCLYYCKSWMIILSPSEETHQGKQAHAHLMTSLINYWCRSRNANHLAWLLHISTLCIIFLLQTCVINGIWNWVLPVSAILPVNSWKVLAAHRPRTCRCCGSEVWEPTCNINEDKLQEICQGNVNTVIVKQIGICKTDKYR